MPLHLTWRPNNAPRRPENGGRTNLGLDLGGDILPSDNLQLKILPWPRGVEGYIFLSETVGGPAAGRGARESSQGRIIAAFHGTFHLDSSAPSSRRITFELVVENVGHPPHEGYVVGFDPDCIFGVDAVVLTFVNREFHINLPFYVDTMSEGDYLEIKAHARVHSTTETLHFGESAPLILPIRRPHTVITTTPNGSGGFLRYSGNMIGHLVCHHERYLVIGNYRDSRSTNRWRNNQIIEISRPDNRFTNPFQDYSSGMRILLLDELADNCIPDAEFLDENIRGEALHGGTIRNESITSFKQCTASKLVDIFEDAGFTGVRVHWQNDSNVADLVQQFNRYFQRVRNVWVLRDQRRMLDIPFWTFIIADKRMSDVGNSELLDVSHRTDQSQTRNREYELPYPVPIGSGNKKLVSPIAVNAAYFQSDFRNRSYDDKPAFERRRNIISKKFAVTIAHEIGHSLGLMHPVKVQTDGADPYSEDEAYPLFTIMCSRVDRGVIGVGMRFANQDKVIWENVFNVHPNYDTPGQQVGCHFRNKTWSDWRTTDWTERKGLLMRQYQEDSMTGLLDLRTGRIPPPFAEAGQSVQPGTYQPPRP